jgi:hypothetical protein
MDNILDHVYFLYFGFGMQPFFKKKLVKICQNSKVKKKRFWRFSIVRSEGKKRRVKISQISIFGFQCIAKKYTRTITSFVIHIWFIAKFG